MPYALESDVLAAYDSGAFGTSYLIEFGFPGETIRYARYHRHVIYNSQTYIGNLFLSEPQSAQALGFSVSSMEVVFSGVPTDEPTTFANRIAVYNPRNAPTTITKLVRDPHTHEILGAASIDRYEIADWKVQTAGQESDGTQLMTISVTLDTPGRVVREQTGVMAADREHRFDNDPNDSFYEWTKESKDWEIEWGRTQ